MIEPKLMPVYDWDDIKEDICNRMEIQPELFGNYQLVVGGSHKDLLRVATDTFAPHLFHLNVFSLYGFEDEEELEGHIGDYGEWSRKFFTSYHSLMRELDPADLGIFVSVTWA